MKLITQRDQIRAVAERWKAQYCSHKFNMVLGRMADHWNPCRGELSSLELYNELVALNGETATPADVATIIGNDLWCRIERCTECNARPEDAILQVGEEPDYDSATVYLCRDCAAKVANAFPQQAGSVNP